jgi:hypothetical protein
MPRPFPERGERRNQMDIILGILGCLGLIISIGGVSGIVSGIIISRAVTKEI